MLELANANDHIHTWSVGHVFLKLHVNRVARMFLGFRIGHDEDVTTLLRDSRTHYQ